MISPGFLLFIGLPRVVISILSIVYSLRKECQYPTMSWINLTSDQWSFVDGIYTFVLIGLFCFYTVSTYFGINFEKLRFSYYIINALFYFTWFGIGTVLLFQSRKQCGNSTLWRIGFTDFISVILWYLYYLYKAISYPLPQDDLSSDSI